MNVEVTTMRNLIIIGRIFFLIMAFLITEVSYAQQEWDQAELDDVEIDIVKERQITLPKANRNFEKIPPRPSEPINPPIQYDFRPFRDRKSVV